MTSASVVGQSAMAPVSVPVVRRLPNQPVPDVTTVPVQSVPQPRFHSPRFTASSDRGRTEPVTAVEVRASPPVMSQTFDEPPPPAEMVTTPLLVASTEIPWSGNRIDVMPVRVVVPSPIVMPCRRRKAESVTDELCWSVKTSEPPELRRDTTVPSHASSRPQWRFCTRACEASAARASRSHDRQA